MANVADELSLSEEFKVGFNTLTRGALYPILSCVRTETTIRGKVVKGLKVEIVDDELTLVTYVPKKVMDCICDQTVEEINVAGKTAAKFQVCYYGTLQSNNISNFIGRLHRPDQRK